MPVHVNIIAAPGSSGSVSYTGVGFQPKALICFAGRQTAPGTTSGGDWAVNFATGASDSGGAGYGNADADSSPGPTGNLNAGAGVVGGGSVSQGFTLVSFDSDGYTFNWGTSATGDVVIVAIGGLTLSAKCGFFDATTGTGTQAVTGVGFQPDMVLFTHQHPHSTFGGSTTDADVCHLGVMTDVFQGAAVYWTGYQLLDPSAEYTTTVNNACIIHRDYGSGDQWSFSRSSLDSDGFTISKDDAVPGTRRIIYLALKDTEYNLEAGLETYRTTTGQQSVSIGERPEGVLLFGADNATLDTTVHVTGRFFVGAASSTTERAAVSVAGQDSVDPSNTSRRYIDDGVLTSVDGSGTLLTEADIASIDAAGFTLDYTTVEGVANYFIWVGLRSTPDVFRPQIIRYNRTAA